MHLKGLPSMVFLVLSPDEDPEVYKEALPEIATQIFINADDDKYKKLVPKLYKQLERYTQMTAEQRQAAIINDPVRRIIIQTLMKQGTIQSAELAELIFEEIGKQIDVDIILGPLVKMGVIATGWVEGLASEVIYLTRAMFVLRKTSLDTIKAVREEQLPADVGEEFLKSTQEYHKDYIERIRTDIFETIWSEAEGLSKHILDFEIYDIIQVLRTGPMEIERLKAETNLDDEKITKKLKKLEKADIIMKIKDKEGRQHIMLKCNPEVITVYPEWLIQRTVDLYNDEEIVSQQAIHYLEVLKKSHPTQLESMEMAE